MAVQVGATGKDVKEVQEWLTLGGFAVAIDGEFGPATEAAVRAFQVSSGSPPGTGIVDDTTLAALRRPLTQADRPISPQARPLAQMTVAYAQQHLAQKPREVGGDNCGPWVRLYMAGHDGTQWPWCAGFATSMLQRAAAGLSVAMPVPYAFGCDLIASKAKDAGKLQIGPSPSVKPGYLFLVRLGTGGNAWQHIGIVETVQGNSTFTSVEGNSNTDGSSNGYEVVRLTRSVAGKDYVVL